MDIHVLLVERDASFEQYIRKALDGFGGTHFHVETIGDPDVAHQIAAKEMIDVALVDIGAGDIDSLTAFKRICPNLPIVALVTSPDPDLAFRVAISGAVNLVVLDQVANGTLPRAALFAAANRGKGAVQDARHEQLSSRDGLDNLSKTLQTFRSGNGQP